MKLEKGWQNKRWGSLTIAACIGVTLFVLLWNLPSVCSAIARFLHTFRPVFLGCALAYVLNPLVRLLEGRVFKKVRREKIRHYLSVLCSVILVVLLLVLLGAFLIPQLISSITGFIANLGVYTSSLQKLVEQFSSFLAQHNIESEQLVTFSEDILSSVRSVLPDSLQEILSLLGNIGTNVFDIVLAAIMAIYFLSDKDRILKGCRMILQAVQKPERYARTAAFLSRGHGILIRYILFELLDALIVGLATFVFMMIAGLPYAVLLSVVAGVTNLAPTFGPIVGCAIGSFVLILVNPWYALYFLIFTVIIQIIDGYILKPRLFGDALGVPGVIVLVFIIMGGRLFGIWGVLLAIPFAAIVYYALRGSVLRRTENLPVPAEETAGPEEDPS